jgi:acetyltransferase-like isoleucine patch superfamily enzyme
MIDLYKYLNRYNRKYRLLYTKYFLKYFTGHIGNDAIIYPQTIISYTKGIFLGDRAILLPHSRIELITDYAGEKYTPTLILGRESQIHQNCHITCAGKIEIGSNVVITSNVTITNIIHPHEKNIYTPINKNKLLIKNVCIEDQVYIYNNSVILPGVKIGKHSIIGANSVVDSEIPAYSIAAGNPAKIIKQYNFQNNKWEKII